LILNHAKASGAKRVREGDTITYFSDTSDRRTNVPADPEQAKRFCNSRLRLIKTLSKEGSSHSPLRVLYEDNYMAIVCKPAGIHSMSWSGSFGKSLCVDEIIPLLLEPPAIINNSNGTELLNVPENMEMDEPLPAPLPRHRLDQRVAGPVIVAKTRRASIKIGQSFEEKTVVKEYRAIVVGEIKIPQQQQEQQLSSSDTANINTHPPSFTIISDVDGRASETEVVVLGQTPCAINGILTDLKLFPRTGRKHQLRIHCADVLGTPILGDDLYWDHRRGGCQDDSKSDDDPDDAMEAEHEIIPDVPVRKRQGLY
jgi:23S rRNA-/tRNA-specific pseudouridylate synthase